MCGICGIIGKPEEQAIKKMLGAMVHRGPDDEGMYSDQFLSIGMRRLAIIDLSARAHQPMANRDQTLWIVYNGEMYNYQSERNILINKGFAFVSDSDTEVVIKMYEYYGDSFLERMEGMFGLCIYDKRKGAGRERILLARDHLGIKPLLYSISPEKLIFSSEIKPLIASGHIPVNLDTEAIALLTIYGSIPQPYTILQGVKMLMPGHMLIYEEKEATIKQFWKLGLNRLPGLQSKNYTEQLGDFRDLLFETVKKHMVADVPVGAFLSGGLDSSLLVAIMKKIGGKVVTFSVGYQQEGKNIDETDDALRLAKWIGTEHHRVEVSGEMLRNKLDHIIFSLDQPGYDGVNSYFVSMAARQSATVAISGTGGDEFFAGYPWFLNLHHSFQGRYWKNPYSILALLPKAIGKFAHIPALQSKAGKYYEYAGEWNNLIFRYMTYTSLFEASGAAKILMSGIIDQAKQHFNMGSPVFPFTDFSGGTILERISGLTMSVYCQNQLLRDIDAVSMAHSLEVRVPFISPEIADFALSLPDSAKINPGIRINKNQALSYSQTGIKKMLLDAGRELLPEDLGRQVKRGFAMPFDWWLKTSLKDVVDDVFSEKSIKNRDIYQVKAMKQIHSGFLQGKIPWTKIWLPVVLELWCRKFIDK